INLNALNDTLINRDHDANKSMISQLRGAFLVTTLDLKLKRFDIYTHVVRAESIYYYEDSEQTIIGTDPMIVSALSTDQLEVRFDPSNFVSFLEMGYFADELTPYKGVECLPANAHIVIDRTGTYIEQIDDSLSNAFSESPSEEDFKTITDDFVESFNVIKDKSSLIKSGLTGGKDSRLVLFALLANGFDVETFTMGFEQHPDVYIARD